MSPWAQNLMFSSTTRTRINDLAYIVYRNVFLLTNGIIAAVVAMLFVFGNTRAAIFLGVILVINIGVGLIQDIRSWITLEKLQLLTAPRVVRLDDGGGEATILASDIQKGDRIKLTIGDQVPSDGMLLEADGIEINEGLITGESNAMARTKGEVLLAGSLVTSGAGILRIDKVFKESRIARMTEGIKKYTVNTSSIQRSAERVIKYSGYALLLIIVFLIVRARLTGESAVETVLAIGTVSSILVPQGLAFMVTLSFAYGAAHLYKQHVLLQQVNATEMLGRIKNLCMDKTGTLTEATLVVEEMHLPAERSPARAKALAGAYAYGSGDTSQTIHAVQTHLGKNTYARASEKIAFSSWRKYGAIKTADEADHVNILAGAPDVFLAKLSNADEQTWLSALIHRYTTEGKHLICLVESAAKTLPKELGEANLSVIAVFVFHNNLREGIQNTINFFQDRGVHIRIISGDYLETVRAVARLAGVKDADKAVTGEELASWPAKDFAKKIKDYSIFARIAPEQKEQIVEAFKKDGFTAMVGDGANDALAIKKADLGIAMFDGASATRRLAAVVLTNNSFAALPGGVALADGIIRNMEIMSGVFLHQSILAFFFFVVVSALGARFPLTPFNVTLMDYAIVGFTGMLVSYWVVRPVEKIEPASTEPFLRRVVPFALASACIQTIGLSLVYLLIPLAIRTSQSDTVVMLAFVILSFCFFSLAPSVYYGVTERPRKLQLALLAGVETLLMMAVFLVPFAMSFFHVNEVDLPISVLASMAIVVLIVWFALYGTARYFLRRKNRSVYKKARKA